jgi:tetratricopeptide (TPR) repeat protein
MPRVDEKRPTAIKRMPSAGRRARGNPAAKSVAATTRLEIHRLIAALSLALLLALSVLWPHTPAAPNRDSFITPRIDGTISLDERAVFPYLPFIERQQANPNSSWPDVSEVLGFDPDNDRVRRAIVGGIYASTSSIKQTIAESGLPSNPSTLQIEDLEFTYGEQTSGPSSQRGLSGLSAIRLIRALNAPQSQRAGFEKDAIYGFQTAAGEAPQTWQYTYNWALANFLAGNYTSAYEGMKQIIPAAENDLNLLPQFWVGLAALRAGDPGEAIVRLTAASIKQAPTGPGANEAFRALYGRLNVLSREALGDAQWANRDPVAAYNTYFDILRSGTGTTESKPYAKWLRLGLQQRGYESLLDDMSTLLNTSDALGKDARLHHDRARLLTFLGRGDEAMQEYSRAVELGESDAPLLISYGQALESRGDYNGALTKAQDAIKRLGADPGTVNLTSVARAAADSTSLLSDRETAQYLLDANLLRARVFGKQGNASAVASLVQGITQEAPSLAPNEGALLLLYGALANEAAGQNAQARDGFNSAWDKLKVLPAGTPGRASALVGLARSTAASQGVAAALDVLKSNGYDPASPPATVATDADAPDILYAGSKLLSQAGRDKEAANALRVSAVARNLQDVRTSSGVGRQLWTFNGEVVPADDILAVAASERASGSTELAVMRYKQAYGLAPALAPAWNNLGVLYAQQGNVGRADFYLRNSGVVSPNYAWGQHNAAAYAYKQGLGGFFSAESAAGKAIKAAGPRSLEWGYDLRYDERGTLPAPSAPSTDLLSRLPALLIVALLLLHTIVGRDRISNRVVVPTRGVLGKIAAALDARFKTPARSGSRALLVSLAIPALVGMLGLAWGAARGSLEVALVFLPVAFIAALLAFAANELAQYLAARQAGVSTVHHNWPLGVLLGIVSIPFGFVYGWQINTRMAATDEDGVEDTAEGRDRHGRHAPRSLEERDLLYEAEAEAAAEAVTPGSRASTLLPVTVGSGRLGLTTGARIIFAGMVANLALALVFGLVYWLTGWPSMRLALFAQALVLAFTSVSEPPADGWTIYRRNMPLWLATFVFASIVVTLLAIGII